VCPWNKEGILGYRLAMWAAIKAPWTRRLLVRLDDLFKFGRQNRATKWWLDLEKKGDRIVVPDGTNEKGIHVDRKPGAPVAVYPVDKLPPAGTKEPVPLDRKQGLEDAKAAAEALTALKAGRAKSAAPAD
jgi:ABC-type amino acid transport substrate-binding protein